MSINLSVRNISAILLELKQNAAKHIRVILDQFPTSARQFVIHIQRTVYKTKGTYMTRII